MYLNGLCFYKNKRRTLKKGQEHSCKQGIPVNAHKKGQEHSGKLGIPVNPHVWA